MISKSAILRPVSHLAAWGVLAASLIGCSSADSSAIDEPAPALGRGQQVMEEFILHAQPSKRKATLRRLTPKLREAMAQLGPGLQPQALTDITIEADGTPGVGTPGTVELVTTAVYDTYNGAPTSASCPSNDLFCADVTLNSFHAKTLNLTYVQVTSITDNTGKPFTVSHNAINSDGPATTGLANTLGLWAQHSANGGSGVREDSTSGYTWGSSTVVFPYTSASESSVTNWQFANPDDADTYVSLRVMAAIPGTSSAYSNYQLKTGVSFRATTFVDACTTTSGSGLTIQLASNNSSLPVPTNSAQAVYLTLPSGFVFNFYGTTYIGTGAAGGPRINFSKFGNLGFQPAATKLTDNPPTFTTSNAPAPGLWPWWDDTVWGTSGGMCARLMGSAPTRSILIGWKKLAFTGKGTSGPFFNYSVELHEATDEIIFNYDGNTGSQVWSAAIGGMGSSATMMTNSTTTTVWPSTTAGVQKRYVLLPVP
jgi:hypothetical protein